LKNFRAQRAALGELDNLKKDREELFYKIERNKHQIEVFFKKSINENKLLKRIWKKKSFKSKKD